MDHVLYHLTLGKSNWDLRTWITLNRHLLIIEKHCRVTTTGDLNKFYHQYTNTYLTPDGNNYMTNDKFMNLAVKNGDLNIVKQMISKSTDLSYHLKTAISYGQLEIIKVLLLTEVPIPYDCFWYKPRDYKTEVFKFLLDHGINYFWNIMNIAAENGDLEIVALLFDKYPKSAEYFMSTAVRDGHMNIVKYMINKGARNFNKAMYLAISGNQKEIVEFMISLGADNFNIGLCKAAFYGQLEMCQLMIDHGANKLNKAMRLAVEEDYPQIVEFLLKMGATNRRACISLAFNNNCAKLAFLIKDWKP